MTKFSPEQAQEIAIQVAAAYRAAAAQIEAIAQRASDPDQALWELHRVILSEPIATVHELAQDVLYPTLRDAAE